MDAAAAALNKFISGQHNSDTKATSEQNATSATASVEASGAETASTAKSASTANTTVDTTTGANDTSVDQEIAPAVEHETVRTEAETREQKVIDRERHQDHYHTTIQPLKAREDEPVKHFNETAATEERKVNNDTEGDKVRAQVEAERSQFQNTSEQGGTTERRVKENTIEGEDAVHHHLHETIQPVIEKERVIHEVTHVTKPVHEVVKEPSVDLGVTKANAISIDEFQGKLSGEHVKEVKHDGEHTVPATTAVTTKEE